MKRAPPPTSYYAGLAGLKTEGQPYTHDEDLVRDCPEVDLRAEVKRLRSMLETRNRLKLDVCPTCGEIGEAVYYLGLYDDMEKEVIRLRKLVEEAYKEGMIRGISIYAGEFTESRFERAWPYSAVRKRLMEGK